MPIVGQFGSLAGFGVFPGGALESIATVTVGSGGASSITFSDIPGTYQHLQLRLLWRSGSAAEITVSLNSDTTNSNYYRHFLQGSGSGAAAGANQLRTSGGYYEVATSTHTASVIDLLDYASTSKNKTLRTLWGFDNNGSGYVGLTSGLWMNTAAVTAIALAPTAGTFSQHVTAALYGVKAP
jgi:hypothetical protein